MTHAILRLLTAIFFVVLGMPVLAQDNPPATGHILEDARLIITSDKNDVRLWAHPPRVVVIADDPFVLDELVKIRKTIEREVDPFYGKTVFGPWTYITLDPDFADNNDPLRFRMVKGGPAGREIALYFGKTKSYRTDIVIAVSNRPTIAVLNGLWGMNRSYNRSQAQGGQARCFYDSFSKDGIRLGAYVSIVLPEDQDRTRDCIREEVLHTLGPLTDAKGTRYFTFDDKIGSDDTKRANDISLLKALYESEARPGDGPSKVIRHLKALLEDRGIVVGSPPINPTASE